MAPRDATMFWLSRRTANDVFLLYCFGESATPTAELRALVAERAARIPDLCLRLRATARDLDYPHWIPAEFLPQQFIAHRPEGLAWPTLLDRLGELLGTGLDATERPWRLHVFRGVRDAPMSTGPSLVVVVQISHALADGTRAAALTRSLFIHSDPDAPVDNSAKRRVDAVETRRQPVDYWGQICGWIPPSVSGALSFPQQLVATVRRGLAADRARRELAERTEAGEVPAPTTGFAPSAVNTMRPVGVFDHQVRMLVVPAETLRSPRVTVTVLALTAISAALTAYLAERGQPPQRLGAALPMVMPTPRVANNNYRSLSIDLHIEEPDLRVRADLIAHELRTRRDRALNPLLAVRDRVGDTVPALFAARDVARADLDTPPPVMDGNTVVSSVNRGAADLAFAGAPVLFTGGFPALGTVMHLTHGVHGIGETITLSVRSDRAAVPDPDRYLALLAEALDAVGGCR
ncbi:wax ester/triacylglycerol synthase domain-containing protein [Nocardia caishijiensis]|uniref:Uncharacterized protein DUF1298 n=1 Tax=Nocardia caishijiensis TaxID=184756 RepID=A0ABQ6YGF9_9NOCA|nr:wax ester/triacylglycerol synthase domain-containing protein [Nocardia caishijiensis]KAF0836770.1 uncharacterized protein DUF1298 [Nocardia caishijiensis]